jgi:5-hydroxyisourate hydrolase
MKGKLTTHILDTAHGRPADGVEILLCQDGVILTTARTNADGRTDEPLLAGARFACGTYELVFRIGDYFANRGIAGQGMRFLDEVPIRFGIADADAHYHVPLLVSPWAYSTYRGS